MDRPPVGKTFEAASDPLCGRTAPHEEQQDPAPGDPGRLPRKGDVGSVFHGKPAIGGGHPRIARPTGSPATGCEGSLTMSIGHRRR
jgi:hypothetical protein